MAFRLSTRDVNAPAMIFTYDFWVGVVGLLSGLLLMGTMYRIEKRPRGSLRPHLLPTSLFMLLGLLLVLGAGAHLLTMFGIHPPQSQP